MVPVIIDESVRIPPDIADLDSFRKWARSNSFPERGLFSYLGGELWVDLSLEQLFSHNQVKARFTARLAELVERESSGYYFSPRSRLSNVNADFSTEPDGIFASNTGVRHLRVQFPGSHDEILGSPDMVLEVISDTSVGKDTRVLRQLYWAAEVTEYWLVDTRKAGASFDILRRGKRGYTVARAQEGWLRSAVFGRSFRLTQQADPLGHPRYTLEMRE